MSLLVVEDDPDTLRLMVNLLSKEGYTVGSASTVATAKALLDALFFDLALVDIGLPDGTGYDLLPSRCPAIALTGWVTKGDVRAAKRAGFKAHLAKPIDFKKLLETVASIIFHEA